MGGDKVWRFFFPVCGQPALRRVAVLWAVGLFVVMAAAATAQPTPSTSQPVIVRLGTTGLTAADWPEMIAVKKGFAKAHGIDLQLVPSQKATVNIQSLIGGSLDFVASGVDSLVLPVENGADLVAVAGIQNLLVMKLFAAQGIRSINDLAGKKLAISRTNGPDAAVLRDLLSNSGVKIDAGLFVIAGGTLGRLAAVVNGGTSATLVIPPDDFRAASAGLVDLGFNVGRTPPRQFVTWITNKAWASQHRDTVVRTLQGLKEALHWLNDPANKEEAAEILAAVAGIDKNAALLAYDVLVKSMHSFSQSGELNDAGIENVLRDIVRAGELKSPIPPISKYVDISYLQ